jgi:nucleoside recognition membrane protein YjiH
LEFDNAGDFAAAIQAEINGKSAQYAPNKDLSEIYKNTNLDLAWAWAFETGADDATKAANNKKDTVLGERAAAGDDLTISIGVSITVTQID